jgi:hypothetical protein
MIEVILGFFSPEENSLLWDNCIAVVYVFEYCILREETMGNSDEFKVGVL